MRTPFRLVSLLLLSGLALLSGCRGSRKDVIRVATFGDPEMQSIARARLDELEKRSGIHAELSFIPYTSYSQKIITQLSAGKAPDVVWVEVSLYTALQNAGALVPLNDLVEKNKIDLSLQYPQVLERFSKDGKVYALPQDTAPIACLYYNRKMFREAGLAYPRDDWRWSDLVAAAKKLTKRGADGRFQVYGFEDNGQPGQPDWPGIVYANGGTLVDDWRHPTRCTLDQPAAVEAIQFLSDIVNVHHISQLQANRESMLGGSQETFGAGRLAMFAGGIWFTPALRKVKDLDWDIAPMPMGPSAKHPGWGTGGSGWSITIDSKDKDKA
ncbi:MAG: sugar ABC transporter substrate-binding protein, partial [candidate division FCPU426 bacterium]